MMVTLPPPVVETPFVVEFDANSRAGSPDWVHVQVTATTDAYLVIHVPREAGGAMTAQAGFDEFLAAAAAYAADGVWSEDSAEEIAERSLWAEALQAMQFTEPQPDER